MKKFSEDPERNFQDSESAVVESGEGNELLKEIREYMANPPEEEFEEAIRSSLEQLQGLADEQEVVIGDFLSRPQSYKVGDLKGLIEAMRDKGNELSGGVPTHIYVMSRNPDEFFRERREDLERSKEFYLQKLAPYPDDLLITYVHPNSSGYTDWSTGKVLYYQKTAGELRAEIKAMDFDGHETLSHLGGISIVSADPNVSMEALENRSTENERNFRAALGRTVDRVHFKLELKEQLKEAVANLPDDATISIPLEDGSQLEATVKELKLKLGVN
ncbi:MAG: hypothetical protein AAB463_01850 [Patescibacteria group bacterium]